MHSPVWLINKNAKNITAFWFVTKSVAIYNALADYKKSAAIYNALADYNLIADYNINYQCRHVAIAAKIYLYYFRNLIPS